MTSVISAASRTADSALALAARPLQRLRNVRLDLAVLAATLTAALLLQIFALNSMWQDYDEGVYWQSLRAMADGQPLFTSVFSSQPPFFLISLYPIFALGGQTLIAARLAVVLYAMVGLVATWWIGYRLAGRWGGVLACLLLAFQPLYVTQAHIVQAEVPMLAFALLGVALAVESRTTTSGRWRRALIVLSGIAVGLAVGVKLFAVVALASAALYVLAVPLARPFGSHAASRRPLRPAIRAACVDGALLVGGFALACLLVLLPFLGQLGAVYDQVIRFHLVAAGLAPFDWRASFLDVWTTQWQGWTFRAALIAIVAAVVVLPVARLLRLLPVFVWLAASFLALVQQHPRMLHHALILVPPVALTLAIVIASLAGERLALHEARRMPRFASARLLLRRGALPLLLPLLLALSVALTARNLRREVVAVRDLARRPNASQLAMVRAIQRAEPSGELVASDSQFIAGLADRDVPPELVDTSLVRIQTGYLTAGQLEAIITREHVRAILFTSDRFTTIPGFSAWVQARFVLAGRFGANSALYVLPVGAPQP